MSPPEHENLTDGVQSVSMEIEEMEERMEMQAIKDALVGPNLCIYFACMDVCPPNG